MFCLYFANINWASQAIWTSVLWAVFRGPDVSGIRCICSIFLGFWGVKLKRTENWELVEQKVGNCWAKPVCLQRMICCTSLWLPVTTSKMYLWQIWFSIGDSVLVVASLFISNKPYKSTPIWTFCPQSGVVKNHKTWNHQLAFLHFWFPRPKVIGFFFGFFFIKCLK